MMMGKNVSTGKPIEVPVSADGATVPVSGTLTAIVDESTLATSAKQDTGNTSLATIAASAAGSKVAGQATMANSVPVALASNQSSVPTTEASGAAIAASLVLLQQPTRYAAVTPSDATDVTATATKGLLVTAPGVVNVTGVGDSGAVGLGTWPAGSYIPGALKRVNAATTATVVSCYGP